MLITKEIEIDMGHRVPNHKSKCANVHGHRYKIEVGVDDKLVTKVGASDEGMVIDFGDLKEVLMERIDAIYDHSYTMYEMDKYLSNFKPMIDAGMKINVVNFIPTAEKLAEHWFADLSWELEKRGITLKRIRVWETPTSTATYAI